MSSKEIVPTEGFMLTKGIDNYVFLDNKNFTINFHVSGSNSFSCSDYHPMCKGSFQINILNSNGIFSWEVTQKEQTLIKHFAEINKLQGDLFHSDLRDIMTTQSIITAEYALSYGFYDCGTRSIETHLTNHDRSYVYLTRNYSEWMKDLAKECPEFLDRPLNALALPGAHDAGMFEIFNSKLLTTDKKFLSKLQLHLASSCACESKNFPDFSNFIERIVINIACTQKDDIFTMLNLGIRYFDFRPGYCFGSLRNISGFKGIIFHQHGFIPGYPYRDFLFEIFKWLTLHPTEIVVVNLNFQGFEEASMRPSSQELMKVVDDAMKAVKDENSSIPEITIGGKEDLNVTIRHLLDKNKRLIFLNQIDENSDASKCDSYNDSYATTDVTNILTALDRMPSYPLDGEVYTVLQLQGTATADPVACMVSIRDAVSKGCSDAMSPLMSTKADFDNSTYPWLAKNVLNKFSHNILIVFINDFVDNALVKQAIDITRKRIDLWTNFL
jgi:hypothetical protein